MARKKDPEPESVIVQAVGTVVHVEGDTTLGEVIEAAMVKAVEDCHADGVTDPTAILKAKLAARNDVLKKTNEAPAALAK